jgi:hypothetical protein
MSTRTRWTHEQHAFQTRFKQVVVKRKCLFHGGASARDSVDQAEVRGLRRDERETVSSCAAWTVAPKRRSLTA